MNPEIEILTDAVSWDAALGLCGCEMLDVFHLYAYVLMEALRLGGWPGLLCLTHRGRAFALPLIFKAIPGAEGLCDASCVYGYNGCPGPGALSEAEKTLVAERFQRALYKAGCVSVFNRGHPFLPPILPDAVQIGETFYVDLAAGEGAYDAGLAHGHAYDLRRLRKSGIRHEHDRALRHVADFHRLYTESMDRLGAAPAYYFSADYLRQLLSQPELGGELRLAWAGDQLAAGAIFLRRGSLAHYHLSASSRAVSKLPATKLILDEFIRGEIRSGRSSRLHLGGGVGGLKDSLADFKQGFAGRAVPYYQTRWITRPLDYARLSAGRADNGFFPLYRCPAA